MTGGHLVESDEEIAAIAGSIRTAAVVGMKGEEDAAAAAFRIPSELRSRGIRVIPVNPRLRGAPGERIHAAIAEVAEPFDAVLIFRRPDALGGLADEILALPPARRPRVVWLQSGIRNDAAAARLAAAGMLVVQDRCLAVELTRLRGRGEGNA